MGHHRVQDLYRHMEWADAVVWAEAMRRAESREDGRLREFLYRCEVMLRKAELLTDRAHVVGPDLDPARCVEITAANLTCLSNALEQFLEVRVLHSRPERPCLETSIASFVRTVGARADARPAPCIFRHTLGLLLESFGPEASSGGLRRGGSRRRSCDGKTCAVKSAARISIDGSGRVVIPKSIREAAGVRPGVPLDVRLRDGRIEIEPASHEIEVGIGPDGLPIAVAKEPLPRLEERQVRQTLEAVRDRRDEAT